MANNTNGKPTLESLIERSNGRLPVFVEFGGYPILYLDRHDDVLCPECAQKALDDPDEFEDWKPKNWFIHYEDFGDTYCSACGKLQEGAYTMTEEEE